MRRHLSVALAAGLALAHGTPGRASEPDFGYVYTTDLEQPGETELALWATDRRGKDVGHYDAQDYKVEVERGLTERFGVSAYVKFASHHVRGLGGEFQPVSRNVAFQGLSAEFKYKLLDPAHDRWGVVVYAEPGWSRMNELTGAHTRELELELKGIVQKNFLRDRLAWATNLTLEPEWEREAGDGALDPSIEKELKLEVASGIAYEVVPKWWLGVEGRYHSAYPDWTHRLRRENYAVYAGPTLHYDAGKWGVTVTWQPQLFGSPHPQGSTLELNDHEKRELRLKLSYEL
jgi:hypothetical protein